MQQKKTSTTTTQSTQKRTSNSTLYSQKKVQTGSNQTTNTRKTVSSTYKPKTTVKKPITSNISTATKRPIQQANKKQVQQQKQQQVQKQKEEESKKQEEKEEIKIYKEIPLTQLLELFDELENDERSPFFIDYQNTSHVFFKYKGNLIPLSDYNLSRTLQKETPENCQDLARKSIVSALGKGGLVAMHLEHQVNFEEFFSEPKNGWWDQSIIFNHKEVSKEKYYKKKLLKPEEDVDCFGTKGHFYAQKGYKLGVIYSTKNIVEEKDLPQLFKNLGLNPQQFRVVVLK